MGTANFTLGNGPDTAALAEQVRAGNRVALARAITLIESRKPAHRPQARQLLTLLNGDAGRSRRVGITGVPGVGKSTLIDALGSYLTGQGHRVAVLAVDPSSSRSGGAILGDKTRMARLAADPNAFIRPSPSSGTLGGVARTTRETILLCEAAGFDVVLVETVGVGQSEVTVAGMVDFFLVLMLAGGGDELQGIKKGVMELADMIAITKADSGNEGARPPGRRRLQGGAAYSDAGQRELEAAGDHDLRARGSWDSMSCGAISSVIAQHSKRPASSRPSAATRM